MKLPNEWKLRSLDEVIESLDAGTSVNSEDFSVGVSDIGVLKTSCVTSGVFNPKESKVVVSSEINRLSVPVKQDRIILSRMNTPTLVGANAYVPKSYSNVFLPDRLWQLEPKGNSCNMRWLSFVLGSNRYRSKLSKLATGTSDTMKNITKSDVMALPIAFPPLFEQKAIADLLSVWDEAIEKMERLITAKEKNLKLIMKELLNEKTMQTKGWKKVTLGTIFEEVTDKVGIKTLIPHSISAGIGFVSHQDKWGKDISGEQYQNYIHLKANEFAYNKGNSKRYQQGCVYLLKDGEICVPNVFISFRARNSEVVSTFYEHYFIANYHAQELKKYITSGARADGLLNLNKSDFFQIIVPFPPKKEQKEIALAIDLKQNEIDILKTLVAKYKEQKRGLMQKLLTGEWRVKGL
jgi:type I restriction enzyme S subunit